MAAKKKNTKKRYKPTFPTDGEILEFIHDAPGKVGKNQIARYFQISGDDRIQLKQALARLRDAGKLKKRSRQYSKSKTLPKTTVLEIVGTDDDGELFAKPLRWHVEDDGPEPKILIIASRSKSADIPGAGDLILARPTRIKDEIYDYKARIVKKLSRPDNQRLLGIVRKSRDGLRITPTEKKARYEYQVASGSEKDARPGELVAFKQLRERSHGLKQARIMEKLGSMNDQHNISLIALHAHGVPHRMPQRVIDETEKLKPFNPDNAPHHKDMRQLELITIDPTDAKDHDDAIWAEADTSGDNPGGVNIIVAIADVAYYVTTDSTIDNEALFRGNSTYLPDRVVPMLPERLSTDLCSLKPDVDRPALACFMSFDSTGKKIKHHFDRIIMRSPTKLSYQQAQKLVDDGANDVPVLKPLWQAYEVLKKGRARRAPLELDLPERKLLLDAHGMVEQVITPNRLDAHKLVEEFMIQANVAAAESLEAAKVPVIYRVHDAPSQEKIIALADFLKTIGLSAPKGQVMKPANFNSILSKVKGGEYEHVVNMVVLRSQSQAVYSTANLGHFGLNLRRYAHFTSPIRRYADLCVHRGLIKAFKLGNDGLSDKQTVQLEEIATAISGTERRSMLAERDTSDRMIAKYLSTRVHQSFNARISGISRAGLFVMLDDTGADGFVPAASLDTEYFVHDEKAHAFIGERTGETFRIGDNVRVKLVEASPLSGGLRFEMISQGRKGKPVSRHRNQPRRQHRGRKGKRR